MIAQNCAGAASCQIWTDGDASLGSFSTVTWAVRRAAARASVRAVRVCVYLTRVNVRCELQDTATGVVMTATQGTPDNNNIPRQMSMNINCPANGKNDATVRACVCMCVCSRLVYVIFFVCVCVCV